MSWKFTTSVKTESPQNASQKDFKKDVFESIVRESIQNSLDNPAESGKMVKVQFEFGYIPKMEIPEYKVLLNHIEAAKEYWSDINAYRIIFEELLEEERVDEFNLAYLKISDYGTSGMHLYHEKGIKRKTPYFAFTRGNNSVKDDPGSGGSEGQGKNSFFAASGLKTIYLHTKSQYGQIAEGLTQLATHQIGGNEYGADGYLGQQIHMPDYNDEISNFPEKFKRGNENGTSITILGLRSHISQSLEHIITAILNNFWLAIHEEKLVVEITGFPLGYLKIEKENLNKLILKILPERKESNRVKSEPTKYGKPRGYYETKIQSFIDDDSKDLGQFEKYTRKTASLGICEFYVGAHPDYPGTIQFYRQQRMLIYRSSQGAYCSKGLIGIFICTDKDGNEILKKMESKTHTEWNPNFCYIESDKKKAEEAKDEIINFILESMAEYRKKYTPDYVSLNPDKAMISKAKKAVKKKKDEGDENEEKSKRKEKSAIQTSVSSYRDSEKEWTYQLLISNVSEEKSGKYQIKILPSVDGSLNSSDLLGIETFGKYPVNEGKIEADLTSGTNSIKFKFTGKNGLALKERMAIGSIDIINTEKEILV